MRVLLGVCAAALLPVHNELTLVCTHHLHSFFFKRSSLRRRALV
jgi:hypothetical protein